MKEVPFKIADLNVHFGPGATLGTLYYCFKMITICYFSHMAQMQHIQNSVQTIRYSSSTKAEKTVALSIQIIRI
jgi:hypothetical protein